MIFYEENKLQNLLCPYCGSVIYQSVYPENYPEYPYGCRVCDRFVGRDEAVPAIASPPVPGVIDIDVGNVCSEFFRRR